MPPSDELAAELEALAAIYDPDIEVSHADAAGTAVCSVWLPSRSDASPVLLRALLPPGYPGRDGPVWEASLQCSLAEKDPGPGLAAPAESQLAQALAETEALFTLGEPCLFACIEHMRGRLAEWREAASAAADAASLAAALAAADVGSGGGSGSEGGAYSEEGLDAALAGLPESSGRVRARLAPAPAAAWWRDRACLGLASAQAPASLLHTQRATARQLDASGGGGSGLDAALLERMRPLIVSGDPSTERKSTFQAHVAPVTAVEQVHAVVAVLLESSKIRHATHNMMAYRIEAVGRPGVFHQDADDDGEAAAGGRLLHLLQVADVRNCCVVVSRWFGGVLLGPSRFALINNCARQLLEARGYIQPAASRAGGGQGGGGSSSRKAQHSGGGGRRRQ